MANEEAKQKRAEAAKKAWLFWNPIVARLEADAAEMRNDAAEMASAKDRIYREIFPWYTKAMAAACGWGIPDSEQVFRERERKRKQVLRKADRKWKELTGLAVLCDAAAWYGAAVRAGYSRAEADVVTCGNAENAIRDWAAGLMKRKKRAPAVEDQAGETLLDRLADILTPQGYKIVKFLWDRKHSTSYDTLAKDCWSNEPTDDAIHKALKRVAETLNANTDLGVTIEIHHSKRRAKLVRPPDNSGDK